MDNATQIKALQDSLKVSFKNKLEQHDVDTIQPKEIDIFQINLGKLCNQTCRHCHVEAGPNRTEIMDKLTIDQCIGLIEQTPSIHTVDITGGAPEMNPNFYYLIERVKAIGKHAIDRCNLTILEHPNYSYLYNFLADNQVEIVASLPHYAQLHTDKQRGEGVYATSIKALKKLNQLGYGAEIPLNLVYNPVGMLLSSSQEELEKEFKYHLKKNHDISFTNLYCMNNVPINRFLKLLLNQNKLQEYMQILLENFNYHTVDNLMCRNQISVSWDGYIYDCDFNQMLDLKVTSIQDFNHDAFMNRNIHTENHCFACTAGAGSSCGGTIENP